MHTFDTIIKDIQEITDDVKIYTSDDENWVKYSTLHGHYDDNYFSIVLMDDGNSIQLRISNTTDDKFFWYEFLRKYVKVVIF